MVRKATRPDVGMHKGGPQVSPTIHLPEGEQAGALSLYGAPPACKQRDAPVGRQVARKSEGLDIDRLEKVLGRLGSAFAGERAAAALKGSEMVRAAGRTWPEV